MATPSPPLCHAACRGALALALARHKRFRTLAVHHAILIKPINHTDEMREDLMFTQYFSIFLNIFFKKILL
jgi:hypothetical protein